MTAMAAIDEMVDTRLLRMPGSPDLAVVQVTCSPGGEPSHALPADQLRLLGARLRDFAAAGEISALVIVVASSEDATAVPMLAGAAPGEDLASLVTVPGMPALVALDGVDGPQVAGLARAAGQLVHAERQRTRPADLEAERIAASGRPLLDALAARLRTPRP